MENDNNRKALFTKLNKIQSKIGQLSPEGYNDFSNYNFISSNQLLTLLNKLFVENNIIVISNALESTFKETGKTSTGSTIYRTCIKMQFQICDCETGYIHEAVFQGADVDSQGKDHAQAITQCHKRFYMKLFNIAEKDNEPDSKSVESRPVKAVNEGGEPITSSLESSDDFNAAQLKFNPDKYTPIETERGVITNTNELVPKDYWTNKDKAIIGGNKYFPWKVDNQYYICFKGE
jgi:hypothetical protein